MNETYSYDKEEIKEILDGNNNEKEKGKELVYENILAFINDN